MDGYSHGVRHGPFIPHMGLGHVAPEVKLQLVSLLELNWLLEREEDGEPGEHAGGVGGGQDGDHDLLVKVALKISSEPVED